MNGDDLCAWIEALRGRVQRGDLANTGPIEVEGGTLASAQLAARIMLADLDHFDDLSPAQRSEPLNVARRARLLDDLRRLRERIG